MSEPSVTPPVPPVEPPAPPVPPAPPAPPVPPVPRYGEYAPSGYVAPAQPQSDPYAAPQLAQPYGAASYPPQPMTGRRRKTWDLVLTCVLLAVGFFGMLIGLFYAAAFSDPALMDEIARGAGLPGFTGDVGGAGAIIAISHLLLYLIAVGVSLPLLITKRVAFWVPLAAGIIAAVIFWGTFTAVMLTDPGFVALYS